jgi:hypothetical protein
MEIAELMQNIYDENGVAGNFEITAPETPGLPDSVRLITFTRFSADDIEYIYARLPSGDFSDIALINAASEQLLDELTCGAHVGELMLIIQSLKDKHYSFEGVEKIRVKNHEANQ